MLITMGVISALNFILILWKLSHNRTADGILDFIIFVVICTIFAQSGQAGIFVGMVASFVVSIYLLFNPPRLTRS